MLVIADTNHFISVFILELKHNTNMDIIHKTKIANSEDSDEGPNTSYYVR